MSAINRKTPSIHTHERAKAKHISPEQQLRRSVMACMLWEKEFYEGGETIADRIGDLVKACPDAAAAIAVEARQEQNLRHVPLLIVSSLAKIGYPVKDVIPKIIRRADELSELVAVHCHVNGVSPGQAKKVLSAQMKKGLATAFQRFDEYQLAKYNREKAIMLRDVLFMCHAKPKDKKQACVWKRLATNTLKTPDTWEVNLSAGEGKGNTFERLIREGNLGYMALLRNLRTMSQCGADVELVKKAILARENGADKVLPFRFIAAARHAPQFERELDQALMANVEAMPKLPGKTLVLVDVSISMNDRLSGKSELTRMDAAAALASIIPSDDVRVFSFSAGGASTWGGIDRVRTQGKKISVECPPRKGMAGIDAIVNSQSRSGTLLGMAVSEMNQVRADRLIVITDEQSSDPVPDPVHKHAYMINVASNRNGVGYGKWTHIDGFSESVIKYLYEIERS